MKPAPLEYARPRSVDEALALLADYGDEAKVLAGGQSLIPLLNMRLGRPAILVDINHVVELDNDPQAAGDAFRVGALVRQAAFRGVSPLGDRCLPFVGHFVTRNRGTICGSIAHADARGELPLALLTQAGAVVAASAAGRRTIAARDFFVTHFTTMLDPTELVLETHWPRPGHGWGWAFEEFALRAGDYALAMAAVGLQVENGRVSEARVGIGATTDRPVLLGDVEQMLAGEPVGDELARAAGAAAAAAVEPTDSVHASAAYQRHLTALAVERAVAAAYRSAVEAA